jgi:hypothetical protein
VENLGGGAWGGAVSAMAPRIRVLGLSGAAAGPDVEEVGGGRWWCGARRRRSCGRSRRGGGGRRRRWRPKKEAASEVCTRLKKEVGTKEMGSRDNLARVNHDNLCHNLRLCIN